MAIPVAGGDAARAGHLALRVRHVPGLPLVSLRVFLRGGVAAEPLPGLSLITGRMLGEGTARRDWRTLAVDVEDRGMYLGAFGASEGLGVSLDALAGDWRLGLDWLAECALAPSFPEERVRFTCRQTEAELASLLDQPDVRTGRAFLEQLYDPHPVSRPLQGDAESLARIDRDDCTRFHRSALAWGGCVTVAGDIDEDEVLRALEEVFAPEILAEITTRGDVATPPEAPKPAGGPARRTVDAGDSEQAHLYLGHLSVPRGHDDVFALELAGVVLGAGGDLSGRIPMRVREKEGLAYHAGVGTVSGAGLAPGRVQVYVGTSPERVERAEAVAREELERFVDEGLVGDELEEARAFLLGREPFHRETLRQWADLMAVAELYGIPIDRPGWRTERLRAVTADDIEGAVRRWIRPDDLKVTVGLPSD